MRPGGGASRVPVGGGGGGDEASKGNPKEMRPFGYVPTWGILPNTGPGYAFVPSSNPTRIPTSNEYHSHAHCLVHPQKPVNLYQGGGVGCSSRPTAETNIPGAFLTWRFPDLPFGFSRILSELGGIYDISHEKLDCRQGGGAGGG